MLQRGRTRSPDAMVRRLRYEHRRLRGMELSREAMEHGPEEDRLFWRSVWITLCNSPEHQRWVRMDREEDRRLYGNPRPANQMDA